MFLLFFVGNPNSEVSEAFKAILEGLCERQDQHGHGIGQGVDNFYYLHMIHVFRSIFQGKPEFHYFRNNYT